METIDSDHCSLIEAVAAINLANSSKAVPHNEPNVESGGIDSGYVSQSSTPDSLKSTFIDRSVTSGKNIWPQRFRKPKKLRPYNKPIPQLTWDRFSDLREQYAERLNQFTRSLPNCPSILMTLQVLGEDEETAEPWVFVQCDKTVFKKINNFFKQVLIKIDFEPSQPDERSPRLRVLVCPLKPRQLAKDANLSSQHDPLADGNLIEIFGDNDNAVSRGTLCGKQIANGHSYGICQATMGGIIMVVDQKGTTTLFGMTAGHFLLPDSCDEREDELSDNLDDDFSVDEFFELDLSSIEANIKEEETLSLAKAEDERGKRIDINKWSKLGKLSEASYTSLKDGRNLDWALISIDNYSFSLPNISLLNLDEFGESEFSGPEPDVVMLSALGLKRGNLSSSSSYLMLPPGKVLVRTYLLSFSDGNKFQSGDSGAWVVDLVVGKVYGHVVASDVFGRGYVVPLCDSFEDIKNRLSADLVSRLIFLPSTYATFV